MYVFHVLLFLVTNVRQRSSQQEVAFAEMWQKLKWHFVVWTSTKTETYNKYHI